MCIPPTTYLRRCPQATLPAHGGAARSVPRIAVDRHLPIVAAYCPAQPPSAISTGSGHDLSAVRGKVFLFQNPAVMQFMAGNDVGKCTDRDFILVGDAATRPGRFVKIPK
jgi:hypothetical protein